MIDQDVIERLKVAVKALKGRYRELKQQAESSVASWRWATGLYYGVVPFRAERLRLNRGKPLDSEPRSPKNVVAFGFDEQGKLVIVRSLDAAGKARSESFFSISANVITEHAYLQRGTQPAAVAELTLANGRPRELYRYGSEGDYSHETYEYREGTLASIEVEQHRQPMTKLFKHRFEFDYGKSGGTAYRVGEDGKRVESFKFQVEGAAETSAGDLAALLQEFEVAAAREVHEAVRNSTIAGSATTYCLALNYGNDPARSCIAVMGLGLLRRGEKISVPADGVGPDEEDNWNPAEFSSLGDKALQPRGAALLALDRKLSAAHAAGAEVDLQQLWNRIAIRLNRLDWSPLRVSKGFIVYAVDDGLAHLSENLSTVVRARRS